MRFVFTTWIWKRTLVAIKDWLHIFYAFISQSNGLMAYHNETPGTCPYVPTKFTSIHVMPSFKMHAWTHNCNCAM